MLLHEQLTPREMQVLKCIARGKTNRQIAEALVLSIDTVVWFAHQVYTKLDVKSRTQAALYAWEHGLVTKSHDPAGGLML